MKLGTLLLNTNQVYYTPWMQRSGDNAVFSYEIIQALVGGAMVVGVYHKDTEDPGPGEQLGNPVTDPWIQNGRFYSKTFAGLKELVRFGVACNAGVGAVYRIFRPTWYDAAS